MHIYSLSSDVWSMLSFDGWSVGIGFCFKIIIDIIIGAFFIYKAKRNNIKLLYYAAFVFFSYILSYSIYVIDFFHILITDNNIEITEAAVLIYYTGYLIVGIAASSLGLNLVLKEKRQLMLIIVTLYYILLEILAFSLPNSGLTLSHPAIPGENLTRIYFTANSIMYYISFPSLLLFVIIAFAFLLKGLKVKGNIRKKFISLCLAFGNGVIFFILSISFSYVGVAYIIIFLALASLGWIPFYYGLTPIKATKPKKKKTPSDVEMKFVSYLTQKPSISDESQHQQVIDRDMLIFISYSSKDTKIYKVREIAEKLKSFSGITEVLFYEGESFDNIIKYMNDNLGKCDVFLLFCSQNALSSVPVEKEWTAAEALGVPIIPIFFDLKHVPPLLQSRLGVEYDFYNVEQTVKDIYSSIVKKCVERD